MYEVFFLIPLLVYCESSYFGIRVAKSLGSMVRDNLVIAKNASDLISGQKIEDIKDTRNIWLINAELNFNDIKVTKFTFDKNKFTSNESSITSEGILKVSGKGNCLHWLINFNWKINLPIYDPKGSVEVQIASNEIAFQQRYEEGKIATYLEVKWNVGKLNYKGMDWEIIKDWVMDITYTKLVDKLTPIVAGTLNSINEELIKTYGNMTISNKNGPVIVSNKLLSGTRGLHKEKAFLIMDFAAEISAPNKQYRHIVKANLSTAFNDTDKNFDYEVCFNSKLFGEYMEFLVKADYPLFKEVKKEGYHRYIGFYKRIVHSLGDLYSDNIEVAIEVKGNPEKSFEYIEPDKFLIPIKFCFIAVESKTVVLTFDTIFVYQHEVIETKDKHIIAALLNGDMHRLETEPKVNYQSKLAALDFAKSLSRILTNYTIAEPNGFFLTTIRADKYTFKEIEIRPKETCFLYTDDEV